MTVSSKEKERTPMPVFLENNKRARAFFENLAVGFTDKEGAPIFPVEARPVTSQDLAVLSKEVAYAVNEMERRLGERISPIGALVCITGSTPPPNDPSKRRRRIWDTNQKAPSVVSQFTAALGPDLHFFRGEGFGKLVRIFASYDTNGFGLPENTAELVRAMAGMRTLFVVDTDGEIERIARLIKSCLSRVVHGEALRLSQEEQGELNDLPEDKRGEEENEIMSGKRSLLTAGVLFLVKTRSETELVEALEGHLGFAPRMWAICDNAKPSAKLP